MSSKVNPNSTSISIEEAEIVRETYLKKRAGVVQKINSTRKEVDRLLREFTDLEEEELKTQAMIDKFDLIIQNLSESQILQIV